MELATQEKQYQYSMVEEGVTAEGCFDLASFFANNPEFDNEDDSWPIRCLKVGEAVTFGGGAFAETEIRRVQ